MPVKDLVNGINNAPSDVKHIADNLPYRDYITLGVLVSELCLEKPKHRLNLKLRIRLDFLIPK